MESSTTQIISALILIITSFSGLMVWLIKRQDAQNERLQDRYLTHMETRDRENTDAMARVVAALSEVTATLVQIRDQDAREHQQIKDLVTNQVDRTLTAIGLADIRPKGSAT